MTSSTLAAAALAPPRSLARPSSCRRRLTSCRASATAPAKSPEELAARWEAMPDKIRVRKTLDLMEHGAESIFVPVAFRRLQRMCAEMEEALAGHDWLLGPDYSLADAMLTAYVFRIRCLGMQAIWESRFPCVSGWVERVAARPSWDAATAPWLDAAEIGRISAIGRETFTKEMFPEFL